MFGQEPKTTLIGVVLIGGSLLYLGMRAAQGVLSLEDVKSLLTIAAGVGFLAAADSMGAKEQRHHDQREAVADARDEATSPPPGRDDPAAMMAAAQRLHAEARWRREHPGEELPK